MKRHVNEIHNDELALTPGECKSLKHGDSHVKLEIAEAFCCEFMKYFSNVDYLKEHERLAHQLINCDICGTKQSSKNIQRHLRMHEKKTSADLEAFRCDAKGCLRIFSTIRCSHL